MTANHLKPDDWAFSLIWPRKVVAEVDRIKGDYITRNKFLLKIVTEHLEENNAPSGQKIAIEDPTAATTDADPGVT